MIYVVGDSHALCGFYNVSPFAVLHLGPRTARMLPFNHHDEVMSALNVIPPGSRIIFVFGNIDCMHHVDRDWIQSDKDVNANIDEIVGIYAHYIGMLRSIGFLIYPLSASPPGDPDVIANRDNAIARANNIVNKFNIKMGEKCIPFNIPFINVHHFLIGYDGIRNKEYVHDSIHLNKNLGRIVAKEYFKIEIGAYNA